MQFSKKKKARILQFLLKTISCLSNQEYQKKAWIIGGNEELNDFDETVCLFFDDCNPILDNYGEYNITKDQYEVLKNFRDQFDNFCDRHDDPNEFIDSPEWAKVMKMAQEVLDAFDYKKPS